MGGTPYANEQIVTTTGANQIVAVPLPGRCRIDRVGVVRTDGAAFTVNFFNRAFTGPAVPIYQITSTPNGKTVIQLYNPIAIKVGDVITVASSTVSGYNTSHRVQAILAENLLATDQAFTAAAGPGGTAALAIPAGEQPLYKALATLTGTGAAEALPNLIYVNLDPLLNLNIGVKRYIYCQFDTAGTFKVSFRVEQGVAFTG
jgi:hypothetical protein